MKRKGVLTILSVLSLLVTLMPIITRLIYGELYDRFLIAFVAFAVILILCIIRLTVKNKKAQLLITVFIVALAIYGSITELTETNQFWGVWAFGFVSALLNCGYFAFNSMTKEEVVEEEINIEGDMPKKEQSLSYVESRFGSIELFEDYFVISFNFVPFLSARRKRSAGLVYYDQLVNAMFQPAGWFRGHIWLWSKSCMRQRADTVIPFRLWLPSSSRKNSKEYEAIYNKILEKMHANKKALREEGIKNVIY